jgi:hypothetical protein
MNLSDLNEHEVSILKQFTLGITPPDDWIEVVKPSAEFRQAIDILVLSGLAERRPDPRSDGFGPMGWLNEWRLTDAGIEAADYKPQTSLFTS